MDLIPRRLIFKLLSPGWGIGTRFPIIKSALDFLFQTFKVEYARIHGHRMYLGDDRLLLSWRKVYEPESTKLVIEEIQRGNTVFDVGAHIGYYTLLFAKLVGPQGKVVAFEPHPKTFEILAGNVTRNSYQNVALERVGLSNQTGTAKLYLHESSSGDHSLRNLGEASAIEIETRRADEFNYSIPDFVKIDVEGAELLVLQGMKELLSRNPKVRLLIEYQPLHQEQMVGSERTLLDFLEENGFVYTQYDRNLFCRRGRQ